MNRAESPVAARPSRPSLVAGLLALALLCPAACGGPGGGGQAPDGGTVGRDGGVSDGGSVGQDGGVSDGGRVGQDGGVADGGSVGQDGGVSDGGVTGQDGGVSDGGSGGCAGTMESLYIDQDGDGYTAGKADVCVTGAIPPGYTTTSKGPDCNDLDGRVMFTHTAYVDADGDGVGSGSPQTVCVRNSTALPPHYADKGGDCDDHDPAVHPGLPEIPDDGVDNDCAGGDSTVASLPNVIYVDASSGPGVGTASNPFGSLEYAVSSATPGSVIVLAQGNYQTSNAFNFDGKTLVIEGGYTAGTPWKRTGGRTTTRISTRTAATIGGSGANITLDNLTLVGPQVTNVGLDAVAGIQLDNSKLVTIDAVVGSVTNAEAGTASVPTGIKVTGGSVELIRTAVEGNHASVTSTQPLEADSTGVSASNASVRIVQSTVSGGKADAQAGPAFVAGVYVSSGSLDLYDSSIGTMLAAGQGQGSSKTPIQARGVVAQAARVMLAGNTFDGITAKTTNGSYFTDARAINLVHGSSQIVGNAIQHVSATDATGDTASYGIVLQGQVPAWLDDNRVTEVNAEAHDLASACRGDSNGIAVIGGSTVLLQRNFVGSGWLDVYPDVDGCTAAADGLLVKGPSNVVVAGGNVFVGQSVTGHTAGPATVIGRGMVFVGSSKGVFIGNTFVASDVTAVAPGKAQAQTIMIDGGPTVLIADSAIVAGTGADQNVGLVRRSGGTAHLFDDAFVKIGSGFSALVVQGANAYTRLSEVNGCASWKTGCGSATGHNRMAVDPFVGATGGVPSRDYHLLPTASLVDAVGDPTRVDLHALSLPPHEGYPFWDFDGDRRPQGSAWDIGADERVP